MRPNSSQTIQSLELALPVVILFYIQKCLFQHGLGAVCGLQLVVGHVDRGLVFWHAFVLFAEG
jgi:hypothetical protein